MLTLFTVVMAMIPLVIYLLMIKFLEEMAMMLSIGASLITLMLVPAMI